MTPEQQAAFDAARLGLIQQYGDVGVYDHPTELFLAGIAHGAKARQAQDAALVRDSDMLGRMTMARRIEQTEETL